MQLSKCAGVLVQDLMANLQMREWESCWCVRVEELLAHVGARAAGVCPKTGLPVVGLKVGAQKPPDGKGDLLQNLQMCGRELLMCARRLLTCARRQAGTGCP